MTSPNLRDCCQQAVLDGVSPQDHFLVCDARADDPPEEQSSLFDIAPPASDYQGGAHL